MKRALTISLLLFFLAESVGFVIFLLVDWYEVKKEMRQFLNSEEFEKSALTLNLDKAEFAKIKWIEHDREFLYQGKLYDVASINSQNPKLTTILCVEDHREAGVFKNVRLMVDHDQSTPNQQGTFILSVFKFLSGLVFQLISFPLYNDSMHSFSGDTFVNHYQFSFLSTTVQPPNFI